MQNSVCIGWQEVQFKAIPNGTFIRSQISIDLFA